MNWHYVQNGQQCGPVNDEALKILVNSGTVQADTLVWREGMAGWEPYGSVFPSAAAPAASAPRSGGEAVCSECHRVYPSDEVIRHGNSIVCAACKPIFLQKLKEGVSVGASMAYAGFWIRVGAKILDTLIVYAVFIPLVLITGFNKRGDETSVIEVLISLGMMVVALGYQTFFVGKFGATPGKMICKLRVVTADGGRVSYLRAFGRIFAEGLSGMICYIGYIMVAFDDEKRGLHDRICNTRVIHR